MLWKTRANIPFLQHSKPVRHIANKSILRNVSDWLPLRKARIICNATTADNTTTKNKTAHILCSAPSILSWLGSVPMKLFSFKCLCGLSKREWNRPKSLQRMHNRQATYFSRNSSFEVIALDIAAYFMKILNIVLWYVCHRTYSVVSLVKRPTWLGSVPVKKFCDSFLYSDIKTTQKAGATDTHNIFSTVNCAMVVGIVPYNLLATNSLNEIKQDKQQQQALE